MNYFKVSTVQMKKIEICQPFQKPLPCTPSQSHIPSSRKWPPGRPAFHSDHFLTFSFFIVLSPKCAFLEAIFYCRPFKNISCIFFFFSHKYLLICRFLLFHPSLAYRPLTCTVSHSLDFFYLSLWCRSVRSSVLCISCKYTADSEAESDNRFDLFGKTLSII